jgi:hypothetical protein
VKATLYVFNGTGYCQNDHGNLIQIRIGFDYAKDFSSICSGKVQIQKDEARSWRLREFAAAEKKVERLVSVGAALDGIGQTGFFEGPQHRQIVVVAIFHDKDDFRAIYWHQGTPVKVK